MSFSRRFAAAAAFGLILAQASAQSPSPASSGCGYVSGIDGQADYRNNLFLAEITKIDGESTPLEQKNRYRLPAGTHEVTVADHFEHFDNFVSTSTRFQIEKMKQTKVNTNKTFTIEVKPGTMSRLRLRLLKDKLDSQSIKDNAYWEPVVAEELAQSCK